MRVDGDVGWRGRPAVGGTSGCAHLGELLDVRPLSGVCEACAAGALTWQALLLCRTCGYVGCSDDSRGLHARRHYEWVDHPIVSALGGRGDRGWCYADAMALELPLLRP